MLQDMSSTPFTLVTAPQQLQAMVQHLASARELAVDLEHHSFRSFQGFTCLLQLSTRQQDFVVDTLSLRGQLGPALAPIFADSQVLLFGLNSVLGEVSGAWQRMGSA